MKTKPDVVTLTLNPALDLATSAPKVEPVNKLRCEAPRFDPGGGGINVARVIHRLGGSVLAIYPEGGPAGHRLTALLAAEGAPTSPVAISGDTRESVTVTDRSDGGEYRFVFPGPQLSDSELTACLDAVLGASADGGLLVASGSLPPGAPPDTLAHLARRAREAGHRMAVDTSGAPLAAALKAGVHLVKPNLRELSDHLGRKLPDPSSRLAACRALISEGSAEVVALSQGEGGAFLVTSEEAWSAPAIAIRPVSTVGAGDSFLGGLLWAFSQDLPAPDALRYGMAAGAGALLAHGTGLCRREDVMRLAEQVRPTRLG